SRDPELDEARARQAILQYAADAGWRVASVARDERGVLPMPWEGSLEEPKGSPFAIGYPRGRFHPATGYSFPLALPPARHPPHPPPLGAPPRRGFDHSFW